MKKVLFILAINFLIHNCSALNVFYGQINNFLALFGLGSDPTQYEKIQSDPEPGHDPLYILLANFDGKTTMGTVGNPMLLGQYIKTDVFIDLLIACPKKDENQITATRTLVIEKDYFSLVNEYSGGRKQLPEESSQKDGSDVQNDENGANEEKSKQDEISNQEKIKDGGDVLEHTLMELDSDLVKNSTFIADHKDDESNIPMSNQEDSSKLVAAMHEKIEDYEDAPKHTAMELDSNQEKDGANISNHHKDVETNSKSLIQEDNEEINTSLGKRNKPESSLDHNTTADTAVSKKNKVNASDEQRENRKEDGSDQNKIEIDQASIQKTNGADHNKPETDLTSIQKTDGSDSTQTKTLSAPESKTQPSEAPVQKINNASDRLTPKSKKYWLRAIDDVNEFKCEKPVEVQLLQYPSKSIYKFYITGFEILLENYENLDVTDFVKSSNRKFRWFWSFTMVLTEADRNVVCVYHEVQFNTDTYKPEINENFDNHNLGKEMMFPGMDISQLYEIENQKKVFQKLFKNKADQKKYFDVDQENFLVKVHLAPLHGFITPAVRQSARSYGNIAPMWSSIRNGAWRKLEDYVNTLSQAFIDLIVITGTYKTLNLDGNDVYLADDKKVPVPLAFWKMVIYGSELNNCHGMLIVTSNNPYKDIGNVICEEDKCHKYGWGYIQEDDITRGRTICCEFTPEILEHLPILTGAQPPRIFDLYKLSSKVLDLWEVNELGEKTTWKERNDILDKLKLDEKMIKNAENEDTNRIRNVEKDPLIPAEVPTLLWENKRVVITLPLLRKLTPRVKSYIQKMATNIEEEYIKFHGHFCVECVIERIRNTISEKISSILTPLPDAEYPSLVLAVDKSKNCIIANVPIVSHRMGPNVEKYLFACPAESNEEIDKNQRESLTKKALFIREAYENPITQEKGKKNKPPNVSEDNEKDSQFMEYGCITPILPSVKSYSTVEDNGLKIEFHLVGFEVYMGKHYESLKPEDYGKKKLKLNKGFAWFNLLIIRFDRKGGNVLSVTCEMYNDRSSVRPPTTEPVRELPDNLFLDHFYGEKDYKITNTYEEDHQQEIFETLFGKTRLLKLYFDKTQEKHLSKVHLVPVDSFVHPLLEQSARTYGNIAPMWESIRKNYWSKVENYVRHLVQAVYGVFVITGTYGTLSLSNNEYDIYLEPDENVKVPLAFWKIITYMKKSHQYYNILIVTENNPREKATDVLCKKSQCVETGWEYIRNDDETSLGRTYCCIITTEILKELQLQVSESVIIDQVLDLQKVPHWEKEKLTLDVARFIRDQMKDPSIDPTIRADNVKYRNENILLDSEIKKKNNNEDEGISITGLVTSLYNDYISPVVFSYLPSFFSSPKNDLNKKSEEAKAEEIRVS